MWKKFSSRRKGLKFFSSGRWYINEMIYKVKPRRLSFIHLTINDMIYTCRENNWNFFITFLLQVKSLYFVHLLYAICCLKYWITYSIKRWTKHKDFINAIYISPFRKWCFFNIVMMLWMLDVFSLCVCCVCVVVHSSTKIRRTLRINKANRNF